MCRAKDVDSSSRTLIEVMAFALSIHFQFPFITFKLLDVHSKFAIILDYIYTGVDSSE